MPTGNANKVCPFFLAGICKFGDKCINRHEDIKKKRTKKGDGKAKKPKDEDGTPAVVMATAAPVIDAKAHRKVSFSSELVTKYVIKATGQCWPSIWGRTQHDPNYYHLLRTDGEKSEYARCARAIAIRLAEELGLPAMRAEVPGPTSVVASGNRKQADDSSDNIGPEKWLLDTGSGHDLIGKKDIPIWNRQKMMSPCVRPIELHTANGIASVAMRLASRSWACVTTRRRWSLSPRLPFSALG